MAYIVAYAHDDFDPTHPEDYFHLGAVHTATNLAAYQNELAVALATPGVTTVIQIDTSKTDNDRFRIMMIRANGRPGLSGA